MHRGNDVDTPFASQTSQCGPPSTEPGGIECVRVGRATTPPAALFPGYLSLCQVLSSANPVVYILRFSISLLCVPPWKTTDTPRCRHQAFFAHRQQVVYVRSCDFV